MFRLNEIHQSDSRQFLPNAGHVHAERIVIDIKLAVPQKIDDIISGADFPCVPEQIIENLHFVLGQFRLPAVMLNKTALQMQRGAVPCKDFFLSGTIYTDRKSVV